MFKMRRVSSLNFEQSGAGQRASSENSPRQGTVPDPTRNSNEKTAFKGADLNYLPGWSVAADGDDQMEDIDGEP